MTRKYELKRRAERQDATRRRIVDAAIELHERVGMMATTMTEVARRAGVSRPTLYRHFPDEVSLFLACTGTYDQRNPPPDRSGLVAIEDPVKRLGAALTGLYGYYADHERIIASGAIAMPIKPAVAIALAPVFEGQRRLAELIATGWGIDSGPGTLLAGAIGHAIAFPTWRELRHEQGLTNGQAVELMVGMVVAARDAQQATPHRAGSKPRHTV
jgi:AcrR family transcriptional regulator